MEDVESRGDIATDVYFIYFFPQSQDQILEIMIQLN